MTYTIMGPAASAPTQQMQLVEAPLKEEMKTMETETPPKPQSEITLTQGWAEAAERRIRDLEGIAQVWAQEKLDNKQPLPNPVPRVELQHIGYVLLVGGLAGLVGCAAWATMYPLVAQVVVGYLIVWWLSVLIPFNIAGVVYDGTRMKWTAHIELVPQDFWVGAYTRKNLKTGARDIWIITVPMFPLHLWMP